MKTLFFLITTLLSLNAYSHGVTQASANIILRPNNLVELKIQFDFIKLLNHKSDSYSLPFIVTLSPEKFSLLYKEVIKLFEKKLKIKNKKYTILLNKRYPTEEQILQLLKTELFESKIRKSGHLYTQSDRRFYQAFIYDFRIKSKSDISNLHISFPEELGDIYVTLSESTNSLLPKNRVWSIEQQGKKAGIQ